MSRSKLLRYGSNSITSAYALRPATSTAQPSFLSRSFLLFLSLFLFLFLGLSSPHPAPTLQPTYSFVPIVSSTCSIFGLRPIFESKLCEAASSILSKELFNVTKGHPPDGCSIRSSKAVTAPRHSCIPSLPSSDCLCSPENPCLCLASDSSVCWTNHFKPRPDIYYTISRGNQAWSTVDDRILNVPRQRDWLGSHWRFSRDRERWRVHNRMTGRTGGMGLGGRMGFTEKSAIRIQCTGARNEIYIQGARRRGFSGYNNPSSLEGKWTVLPVVGSTRWQKTHGTEDVEDRAEKLAALAGEALAAYELKERPIGLRMMMMVWNGGDRLMENESEVEDKRVSDQSRESRHYLNQGRIRFVRDYRRMRNEMISTRGNESLKILHKELEGVTAAYEKALLGIIPAQAKDHFEAALTPSRWRAVASDWPILRLGLMELSSVLQEKIAIQALLAPNSTSVTQTTSCHNALLATGQPQYARNMTTWLERTSNLLHYNLKQKYHIVHHSPWHCVVIDQHLVSSRIMSCKGAEVMVRNYRNELERDTDPLTRAFAFSKEQRVASSLELVGLAICHGLLGSASAREAFLRPV